MNVSSIFSSGGHSGGGCCNECGGGGYEHRSYGRSYGHHDYYRSYYHRDYDRGRRREREGLIDIDIL